MEQDIYAVIGVAPAAEQEAIRAAYRALMRRYHPDAGASAETAERARAINLAYAVLRGPTRP
jgi:DnaJ-class molecular chaperone